MLGAIIGDIVGSVYEFHNIKTKDFPLFCEQSCFTDDTILTCAVAEWIIRGGRGEKFLKKWGHLYSNRTYENGTISPFGAHFTNWLKTGVSSNSMTNGCVMRISPLFKLPSFDQALQKGTEITHITHNHPQSLNAVSAYLETGYMLKANIPISDIKRYIADKYWYNLNRPIDVIRQEYNKFYCSCDKSVPEAISCALEATSYEDAIRNAVSLGGDSDTLACMTGGLAEIRFKIPEHIKITAQSFMDKNVKKMIKQFYRR